MSFCYGIFNFDSSVIQSRVQFSENSVDLIRQRTMNLELPDCGRAHIIQVIKRTLSTLEDLHIKHQAVADPQLSPYALLARRPTTQRLPLVLSKQPPVTPCEEKSRAPAQQQKKPASQPSVPSVFFSPCAYLPDGREFIDLFTRVL